MIQHRYIATILFTICALTASAQTSLVFTPTEWDFGTILENEGRVSHTFTGTNTTDKPIVILDIFSSCGCTVPEFSRKPIRVGETVEVKVTYDPMNRPGTFIKDLTIYDAERRKVAKLTVRGSVTPRQKSIEELYPVPVADGLRITDGLCAFSYLYHGRSTMSYIGFVNTSQKPVQLALLANESSGLLTLDYPREIAAGACGEINIGYNIPEQSPCYGTVKDVLTFRINGRNASVPLVTHGIAVDNPALSDEKSAPKAEVDKYILKFGVLKRASGLQKLPLRIANTGGNTLIIRAVEMGGGIGCTLRTDRSIEPERSITGYVTIDPAQQEYGPMSGNLTVITNDPSRPMRKVRVTAIIEE